MAYTDINFQTKKELKEAVKAGREVMVVSAGFYPPKTNGTEFIEGPRGYHKWYAQVEVENGIIKKVK